MPEPINSRHRRGDTSPCGGLVFSRYKSGKEVWVTPAQLDRLWEQGRVAAFKTRKQPARKVWLREYFSKYNNTEKSKTYRTAYYKNPEVRERYRSDYASNPVVREKRADYRKSPQGKATHKKSRQKNKDWYRDYMLAYRRRWVAIPKNRIASNCRSRMWSALKCQGTRKASKTAIMLGCSFEFFKGWMESQFVDGMTWENYGTRWEIDHIQPVCSFSLTDPVEQLKAFHYKNCRPLWTEDNRAKSGKIIQITKAA